MRLNFRPGVHTGLAQISPGDDLRWFASNNVRWRRIASDRYVMETIGATAVLNTTAETPTPVTVTADVWTLYPYTASGESKLIAAGLNALDVIEHDTGSTFATPAVKVTALQTFGGGDAQSLIAPTSPATLPIQPFWWFVEQGSTVIGGRAGVSAAPYSWDKNVANDFTAVSGAPTGSVGGAIVGNKLLLLGPNLTYAWSDQFDFTDWTPSDTNQSGSDALDRGSRIIAGGPTGYGVVAWTETAMAIINEVNDLSIVFGREYVENAAGICGNRAWCEAAGRIWWIDPFRVLHVYDGGTPTPVPCPIADATLRARASRLESSYITLTAYPALEEIWINYRIGTTGLNRTLVYNYGLDCWYPLTHFDTNGGYYTAFAPTGLGYDMVSAARVLPGNIEFSVHDAPVEQLSIYELYADDTVGLTATLFRTFRFSVRSSYFTVTDDASFATMQVGHLIIDAQTNPPDVDATSLTAQFNVTLSGLRDGEPLTSDRVSETHRWRAAATTHDFRVDGRVLELVMETEPSIGWDDEDTWDDDAAWTEDVNYVVGRFRWGEIFAEIAQGSER